MKCGLTMLSFSCKCKVLCEIHKKKPLFKTEPPYTVVEVRLDFHNVKQKWIKVDVNIAKFFRPFCQRAFENKCLDEEIWMDEVETEKMLQEARDIPRMRLMCTLRYNVESPDDNIMVVFEDYPEMLTRVIAKWNQDQELRRESSRITCPNPFSIPGAWSLSTLECVPEKLRSEVAFFIIYSIVFSICVSFPRMISEAYPMILIGK
ncbi:hypothetical protein K435DRAFT_795192 [Dendrothele bispora CBS 962.96]|uniref:Uncharacterized protein n=1 Tax=Dendrothele bispora (strain CBS 962.96) TaxID=1314807 RepID=A0A4S8M9F3_DENBC|nr:hypothetical protein K435DRAFT_795192 [Dendrothele bispora CBS 962.96]